MRYREPPRECDWRGLFNRRIGDRLRRRRVALRLSRANVAKAIQVDKHEYTDYERGLRRPHAAVLKRLLQLLQISAKNLFADIPPAIEASGFTDTEQKRYKILPAVAIRSQINQNVSEIGDPETLDAIAQLTAFLAKRDKGVT
ncbi:helix-turn-helix transcriptional regulator [Bosea sp. LjRoot90]|uniref:helix-turn-helix domain-containing protein n=1 Tax=Bosea sp. LjRoot90 TaxID=3342342 RepID=UPI003ECEF0F3